jgi:HEAT repeats
MTHNRYLLALTLALMWIASARAGIFGRQRPNPAQRVPQLITIVKTDPSDSAREKAAAELREYDAAAFPEILAVLIDVLQHDPKAGVRVEAAQSLAKLRPVSQEAGLALEEATRDSSLRVRWQARSSLLGYRLSGYRSQKPGDALRGQEGRTPGQTILGSFSGHLSASTPRTPPVYIETETPPPPLAPPLQVSQPARPEPRSTIQPAKAEPRPLPQPPDKPEGQSTPQPAKTEPRPAVAPATAPKPSPPPAATPDEGPDIPPS